MLLDALELRLTAEPIVWNEFDNAVDNLRRELLAQARIHVAKRTGKRKQDVFLDKRERAAAALQIIIPCVMKIERCAVIDQPEPLMPEQHIRVARRAVNVRDV